MTKETICWFTGAKARSQSHPNFDATIFESEDCDIYTISRELKFRDNFRPVREGLKPEIRQGEINCARKCLEARKEGFTAFWVERDNAEAYRASIAKLPRSNHVVCIYEDIHSEPVDHSEKPIVLLEHIAERLRNDRAFAPVNLTPQDRIWARIVDTDELLLVLKHLHDLQLLNVNVNWSNQAKDQLPKIIYQAEIRMTLAGWEAVHKRNTFPNTNKVFIATQFEWPENDTIRVEAIEAIKRACRACGYEAEVVGQDHTGNITDRIIADIRRSQFVVAELTYNNRGVYFESGFARGIGRPVFHVMREGFTHGDDKEGKKVHFDIQQVMYRTWSEPSDLETQLKDWITATVGPFGSFR